MTGILHEGLLVDEVSARNAKNPRLTPDKCQKNICGNEVVYFE